MKAPCKDCGKRRRMCHAECPEYNDFLREREKAKKYAAFSRERESSLIEDRVRAREYCRRHGINKTKGMSKG